MVSIVLIASAIQIVEACVGVYAFAGKKCLQTFCVGNSPFIFFKPGVIHGGVANCTPSIVLESVFPVLIGAVGTSVKISIVRAKTRYRVNGCFKKCTTGHCQLSPKVIISVSPERPEFVEGGQVV